MKWKQALLAAGMFFGSTSAVLAEDIHREGFSMGAAYDNHSIFGTSYSRGYMIQGEAQGHVPLIPSLEIGLDIDLEWEELKLLQSEGSERFVRNSDTLELRILFPVSEDIRLHVDIGPTMYIDLHSLELNIGNAHDNRIDIGGRFRAGLQSQHVDIGLMYGFMGGSRHLSYARDVNIMEQTGGIHLIPRYGNIEFLLEGSFRHFFSEDQDTHHVFFDFQIHPRFNFDDSISLQADLSYTIARPADERRESFQIGGSFRGHY